MRPLPTSPPQTGPSPARAPGMVPTTLELGPPAAANQRRNSCPTQQAYPWLLGVSTLLAGAFCYLYITKPVITGPGTDSPLPGDLATPALAGPMPKTETAPDHLPGDPATRPAAVSPEALTDPGGDPFEETNLRIQHILGASGPGGEDLGRITLDVPVLYQSGTVRWTEEDVAKARSLLERIRGHRERSRELRDEAVGLIAEWDQLIIRSIPDSSLRADSPTLPENQGPGTADEAPLKSTEAIEIETR